MQWRVVNTYNDKGLLGKVDYYNSENELRHIYTYSYDNNRRLITTIDQDQDDSNTIFTFNDKWLENEVVEENTLSKNGGFVANSKIRFDKDGNVLDLIVHLSGNTDTMYCTYKYDDSSRMIEETNKYAIAHRESKFTYEYYNRDRLNNWKVKAIDKDDSLKSATFREIEYFK